MCNACFNDQLYQFNSQIDFEALNLKLSKKLKLDTFDTLTRPASITEIEKVDCFYKCSVCDNVWVLSVPENAWRGYFLTLESANEYERNLKRAEKEQSLGCLLILLVVSSLAVWIFLER